VAVLQLTEASNERESTRPSRSDTDVVQRLQAEIDSYYEAMALFGQMDLGEILMRLAAISARASGVRSQVVRTESRRMAAFRSRELDPLIEEVDRQFKIWSRLQSVRSMEWDMSRGGA
jgi:hypothetical protein